MTVFLLKRNVYLKIRKLPTLKTPKAMILAIHVIKENDEKSKFSIFPSCFRLWIGSGNSAHNFQLDRQQQVELLRFKLL